MRFNESLKRGGCLLRITEWFARDYSSVFNGKGNHVFHVMVWCMAILAMLKSTGVQILWKQQTKHVRPLLAGCVLVSGIRAPSNSACYSNLVKQVLFTVVSGSVWIEVMQLEI